MSPNDVSCCLGLGMFYFFFLFFLLTCIYILSTSYDDTMARTDRGSLDVDRKGVQRHNACSFRAQYIKFNKI